MRLDFHADRRLQQTASETGGAQGSQDPTAVAYQQHLNAYNRAAPGSAAQREAWVNLINYARQAGLIRAGTDAANKLATVSGELEAKRAEQTLAMGTAAGNADIALQQQRGQSVIQTTQTEATSLFNAKMIVPNMQLSMLGAVKMIASLVGMIPGCNTDNFCAQIDRKIEEIKFPTMDTNRIAGVDTSVSSNGAERNVDRSANNAQADLRNASPEQMASVVDALQRQITGGGSGPAPVASGPTQQTITTSAAKLVEDGVVSQPQGRQIVSAWTTAARNGGDPSLVDTDADRRILSAGLDRTLGREKAAQVLPQLSLAGGPS